MDSTSENAPPCPIALLGGPAEFALTKLRLRHIVVAALVLGQNERRFSMLKLSILLSFLAAVPLLTSGCIYLQNGAQLKTANDASDKFAAFQKSSADTYETMLANQQKLEDAFEEDFQRQSSLHAQALAIAVPEYNWPYIRKQLESFTAAQAAIRSEFQSALNSILIEDQVIATKQTDLTEAKKSVDASIAAAVEKENKLQVNSVLFSEALKAATSVSASKDVASSLKAQATNILNAPVTLNTYTNGKFGSTNSTVGEQLKPELSAIKNGDIIPILKEHTVNQFDPASQPGLSIVILSVAKSMVQSESDRMQLRVQYLADVRGIISDALSLDSEEPIQNTILTLDQVAQGVPPKTTVTQSINRFAKAGNEEGVKDALQVVAVYVIDYTVVLDRLQLTEERLARRAHSYSIQVSSINAKERETLIGLGIQSLGTYQQNGVTPDEIANLIRAAQTAALSFVAAGVF